MTDYELAKQLCERMTKKGFKVIERDYNGRLSSDEYFDTECGVSFEFHDYRDHVIFTFDFLSGDFYRVSGMDSTGGWLDEVDGKKYT